MKIKNYHAGSEKLYPATQLINQLLALCLNKPMKSLYAKYMFIMTKVTVGQILLSGANT